MPLIHAADSAATIRFPQLHQPPYTMVRPGIALFGLSPGITINFTMKPVLSLVTRIIQIKEIQKCATVGYGRTFTADRRTKIALLPVGCADGFRRAPSHWPYVLVQGQRSPVIGRISMDQSTIDVTDIPQAIVGDEVVLIGKQKQEIITAEDVANWLGTINYEVVSSLSARVERIYLPIQKQSYPGLQARYTSTNMRVDFTDTQYKPNGTVYRPQEPETAEGYAYVEKKNTYFVWEKAPTTL